jgi:hypothetical protein
VTKAQNPGGSTGDVTTSNPPITLDCTGMRNNIKGKGKGTVRPITGHENPRGV